MRARVYLGLITWFVSSAEPLFASVEGMMTFQNWEGSHYSVMCRDGSRESVTTTDLTVDNICPKLDLNRPNNILSLFHLESGEFEVVCLDMSRKRVDADQLVSGEVCAAPAVDAAGDLLSGQSRADGNFDLICGDGSREVVSPRDLRLNNLCPRVNLIDPKKQVLSATNLGNDSYLVMCGDLTVHTATGAQVRDPAFCAPLPPPPPVIAVTEGTYLPESSNSYFCDNYLVTRAIYENGILLSFNLDCPTTSGRVYTCQGSKCSGPEGRTAEVLSATKLQYNAGGYQTDLNLQ